jgi:type I restriction enzyme, S subunit
VTYKKYKLEDICEFIKNGKSVQQTKDQKGLPITRIETIANSVIDPAKVGYANLALEGNESYLLKNGDILFSHINSVEHLFKTAKYNGVPEQLIHGMNLLCLRPNVKLIDPQYFLHLLRSDKVKRGLLTYANKSVNQASISATSVKNFEVDIPSLEEQRRITSILDKADDICQKCQQAIAKLDELLQATFIDMFGDPLENPKNFPIKKLSEFYIDPKNGTKCGPFGSALKREEYTDSGIPVWSMDVLSLKGEFHDQPSLWISDKKYSELETYAVIEGDILISRAGTVGKMGVVRSRFEKSIISTNLIRLRFGNQLLSDYFVSLMTFCKTRLPRLKTGADGAFTHMNTGILDNLEFPYPPIEIQNEYLKIYTHIHKQKEALLKSESKFDYLFNALQQKAFNGTL